MIYGILVPLVFRFLPMNNWPNALSWQNTVFMKIRNILLDALMAKLLSDGKLGRRKKAGGRGTEL